MSNTLQKASIEVTSADAQETASERNMELTWQEAAHALLKAVGLMDDITQAKNAKELHKLMRGSGFELTHAPLVHNALPVVDCALGFLIELTTGKWIAVLGAQDDAAVLSEAGEAVAPLSCMNHEHFARAWVLTEHIIDMRTVLPFLQRYKSYFIDLFLAAIVVNIFALTLPLFSSFVYDKILGNNILETMWALAIGVLIIASIEFCVRIMRINVAERFAIGSEVEIDHAMFRGLLDTSANRMPSLGQLMERYKQILARRDFLSSTYILALADVPFLLLFLATIAIVSGPLVLVSLICGTLMLVINFVFAPHVLDYDRKSHVASEKRYGLMTDLLSSREGIIGGALRQKLTERWRQASVTAVQCASKARYWRGLGASLANSITTLSFISILVGGVYMVESHSLTAGGLLAASMLTSRAMNGFSSIINLVLRYREFRTALRELNQIVPVPPRISHAKHHGMLQGGVRFDNVTCNLGRGTRHVLQNVSFSIASGKITGIAGAPGAGKTTLLRLIAGVLQPDDGQVLIDNIPVQNLSPEDISLNMGFKPQDFCLLDGTLEDNVRAGHPPLSADQRHEILIISGLFRVFEEGSLHWDTEIGARGTKLSGGQRQLVSLARAMLMRPPLLLLDEPTNGLDGPSELHLMKQLTQMRGKSTIIVSTHSRNMLEICDQIIVVGQGRILANGPREKVLV